MRSVRYKDDGKLLRTIPGIGPLTSVQILTELGDIERFTSFKKLNSFVGFKPTTYSSGDHDWKGHLSVRKHKSLRSALIECAWQAVQNDPAMLLKYGVGRYRSRVYGLALPGCATSTFVMCYVDLAVPIIFVSKVKLASVKLVLG
mgnify:FL=1